MSQSQKQGQKRQHPYRRTAKPVARTKCTGKVPFIAAWVEGGWDGRDGSTLVASARSRHVSSACTCRCRRCSELLLRWPRVEATHSWCCPLAVGGGEVDGASEPRRATRHDRECQRTLSTRLRTCADNTRRWPPRHIFGSGSLASGAACSRTLSPTGQLQNPTGAASMRADIGSQAAVTGRRGAPQPMRRLKVASAHVGILAMKGW
jgi:hypothetical protein